VRGCGNRRQRAAPGRSTTPLGPNAIRPNVCEDRWMDSAPVPLPPTPESPDTGRESWRMQPITWADRVGVGVVGGSVVYGIYGVTAWMAAVADAPSHQLPTALDEWVVLGPAWILAYIGLFPQALTPLIVAEDRRLLVRGLLAYLAIVLMGLPFWVFWPVSFPRDSVVVTDLFSWGLVLMRSLDPPTNCFPSMHVAESWFAAFLVLRCDRSLGRVMVVGALLIWWSTMAVDQHWFLDGLAGLVVALIVDTVVFRLRPLPAQALRAGPRRRLIWVVLLYGLVFILAALPWWLGLNESVLPSRPW
jgi:membrane-associated phospholipid phosphatase